MIHDVGIKFDEISGYYHIIFAVYYQPFDSFPIDNYYFTSNALYQSTKSLVDNVTVFRYKGNYKKLAVLTKLAHCVGKNTLSYGKNGSRVVYDAIEVRADGLENLIIQLRENNHGADVITKLQQSLYELNNSSTAYHATQSHETVESGGGVFRAEQGAVSRNSSVAPMSRNPSVAPMSLNPSVAPMSRNPSVAPISPTCTHCNLCTAACPTNAIGEVFHPEKCLRSYMDSGEFGEGIGRLMGDRILGCDICQRVCPMNNAVKSVAAPEFYCELVERLPSNVKQFAPLIGKNLARDKILGRMSRNAASNRPNNL